MHLVLDLLDLKGWLVVICILLIVADVIRNKDPPSFPPGPWPLPVFGNVFTGVDFKTMEKVRNENIKEYAVSHSCICTEHS